LVVCGSGASPWRLIGIVIQIDADFADVVVYHAFFKDHDNYEKVLSEWRGKAGKKALAMMVADANALYKEDAAMIRVRADGFIKSTLRTLDEEE
jgi:hypothetical protein